MVSTLWRPNSQFKPPMWAFNRNLVDPLWWDILGSTVLHLPMWEGGGAPGDISPGKQTVTLPGGGADPTWITYERGLGLDFDGGDRLEIADNDLFSFGDGSVDIPFTITATVKLDSNSAQDPIIDKYVGGLREWVFGFTASNSLLAFVYDQSAVGYRGRFVATVSTYVPAGTVHDIAWVYDGGGLTSSSKIYIDGIQRDTTDFTNGSYVAMQNGSRLVSIGAYNPGVGGPYNGLIDNLGIIRGRALSAAAIALLSAKPYGSITRQWDIPAMIGVAAAGGITLPQISHTLNRGTMRAVRR